MLTRRNFIKSTAATSALNFIAPSALWANPRDLNIGIQLYTIRDLVKKDFLGSMKKLAEIGYNTIETAGYSDRKFYGYNPVEFNHIMMDMGLRPMSSHSNLSLENIDLSIEDASEAGMQYLVQPYIATEKRKTLDDWTRIAMDLNIMGEKCKNAGIVLGYHNHDFEFEKIDGQLPYDLLLSECEPDLVTFQLDTYWMVYGGYDPISYFKDYPGRFKLWHIKDMADNEKRESTEIGQGKIDFPGIFEMRKKAGMEYYFLEQEEFKMDPWKSLTISINYLRYLPQ
ncbi:MAG: sugar phosphate isomerase/epimerase [Bacteroidales bacterium]|nr:sugar phosphate isomerase/epimerase [Bacteroidales bacterium]MCF8405436.1 sugar phosphate isomerase/epimerase [Bacteroidales bacterium]